MNTCYDYIFDAARGEFVCNLPVFHGIGAGIFFAIFFIAAVLCVKEIFWLLRRILQEIERLQPPVKLFRISQLHGGIEMAITGVKVGGQGSFSASPLPPGAQLPTGVTQVWSTTDTLVTLTPSADGLTATAAVAATDTGTSFSLTVAASGPVQDGTTPSTTVTVPILALVVTGFDIEQTA